MPPNAFFTLLAHYQWTFAATLLVAILYSLSLSVMPKHVFWMPDEGAKLFELEAATVSWWKVGGPGRVTYRIPFAGQRLLPGADFLPGFDVFPQPITMADGSLYLGFDSPLVFPLLTAPLFHAFGAVGLYILPLISGVLIALLSGVLATWFARALGPAAVLLVGLGTPVWFYSMVFWEHTLASVLGLLAVCLLVRAPQRIEGIVTTFPLILLASMFRTEMPALGAALVVAWGVVAFHSWRQTGSAWTDTAIAGSHARLGGRSALLVSLALSLVLVLTLGSSLPGRHHALITVLPERIGHAFSGIANVPRGLIEVFINSQNLGPEMSPAWIAAAVGALLLTFLAPLIRAARVQAVAIVAALSMMLTCCAALIITGEPYRALHGVFPIAPFMILWPFALRQAVSAGNARLLALAIATPVYLLFAFAALSLTYIHQGLLDVGMEWGHRYLLTAYPMLTVLALVGFHELRAALRPAWLRSLCISLAALLVAAGICLEVRGQWMLYGTKSIMAKWDEAMRSEGPIVTTVWWIPPSLADLFMTHEMFFTWRPGVAQWVERAREKGVRSFTLAHTDPVTDVELGAPRGVQRDAAASRKIAGGLLLTRFRIDPLPAP